jgi:hypothetical protein
LHTREIADSFPSIDKDASDVGGRGDLPNAGARIRWRQWNADTPDLEDAEETTYLAWRAVNAESHGTADDLRSDE